MKDASNGAISVDIKGGMSLEEATKLFPELLSRRGKYLVAAQHILAQSEKLNPQQVHPVDLKNGEKVTSFGILQFTNKFLIKNDSNWRLKFSASTGKYALYNLELLGKKK